MGLFGPSRQERVKERSSFVRKLASQFNADYYYGISRVKDRFNIPNDDDLNDSNIIVGNVENYDYCFLEYYHSKRGKNDSSRWISTVYLKPKEDIFPDFELVLKKTAKIQAGCLIVFGAIFGFPVLLQLPMIIIPLLLTNNSSMSLIEKILIPVITLLFLGVFIGIGYWFIKNGLNKMKKINNIEKYNIRNFEFKQKYAILTDSNPLEIHQVFNEQVCSNIMNYGKDISITFCKNITSMDFNYNEQLTVNLCNQHLNELLDRVKLFKTESSNLL